MSLKLEFDFESFKNRFLHNLSKIRDIIKEISFGWFIGNLAFRTNRSEL